MVIVVLLKEVPLPGPVRRELHEHDLGGAVGVECLPEVMAELAGAALALRLAGGGRDEELGVDELLAVRDVVSLAASSVESGTPALLAEPVGDYVLGGDGLDGAECGGLYADGHRFSRAAAVWPQLEDSPAACPTALTTRRGVSLVDAGQRIAQADRYPAGDAGGQEEHSLLRGAPPSRRNSWDSN